MRKNEKYIFNDEPLSIPLLHKITNQPVKNQQTNILDVHFHFDSNLTTEYTAIFEKLNQALKDKFPGYSGTLGENADGEFEKTGAQSTTSLGYRYMINLGYRF